MGIPQIRHGWRPISSPTMPMCWIVSASATNPISISKPLTIFTPRWKPHYDAILKAVPDARIEGPTTGRVISMCWAWPKLCLPAATCRWREITIIFWARAGRARKTLPATRARFLSNNLMGDYERAYARRRCCAGREGVPYRIDELNSCYNGGAKIRATPTPPLCGRWIAPIGGRHTISSA